MAALNFKNNCVICLRKEDPSEMLKILQTNPRKLVTFQPVVNYLTGTDPTYLESELSYRATDVPVMKNLPPLCRSCYSICSDIYQLHTQLLVLQVLIQGKVEEVRKTVGNTVKSTTDTVGSRMPEKRLFMQRLRLSGMKQQDVCKTKTFIDKFHNKIISEGQKWVVFPARPPPGYVPIIPIQGIANSPGVTTSNVQTQGKQNESPLITSVTGASSSLTIPNAIQNTGMYLSSIVQQTTSGGVQTSYTTPGTNIVLIPGASVKVEFENEGEQDEEEEEEEDSAPLITLEEEQVGVVKNEHAEGAEDEDLLLLQLAPLETQFNVEGSNLSSTEMESTNQVKSRMTGVESDSDQEWNPEKEKDQDSDDEIVFQQPKAKRKRPFNLTNRQRKKRQGHVIPPTSNQPYIPSANKTALSQFAQAARTIQARSRSAQKPILGFLRCEICDCKNMTTEQLHQHLRIHLNCAQGPQCPRCRVTFISTAKLQLHWDVGLCGQRLRQSNSLPSILQCSLCSNQNFDSLSEFRSHVFELHERDSTLHQTYPCTLCNLQFRTSHGVDFHLNEHVHEEGRANYQDRHAESCPPDNFII